MHTDRGHRIDAWVAEGIISPEQAALIRDFEGAETVPARRVSLTAEAISTWVPPWLARPASPS